MDIIEKVSNLLWGFPVLALLLGGGIYLTVKCGFPQIHIIKIFSETFKTIFADKGEKQGISQLQGFSTALAATVGTGSVVGVGAAIFAGGRGAVFWMWVSAFIGMAVSYCENYLGVKYSQCTKLTGAMSYLSKTGKYTAVLYAVFCVLSSLGMGNMAQANSVVSAAQEGFGTPLHITAFILVVFTALTVSGKNTTARVCEKLVPLMALFFILGSLYIIFTNPVRTANAFMGIFADAFKIKSFAGGVIGTACLEGIKRGAFSNEAGLGSTVAVHSSCNIKSPQTQGIMGMAEVFIDTIVICTLTALVIIISGVDFTQDCAVKSYCAVSGQAGRIFIASALILFAFATIAGWFFIGEKAWNYLFPKSQLIYRLASVICVFVGAVYSPEIIWAVSDIFNALMALPNMAGVLILSKQIKRIDYLKSHLERDG